MLRNFEQQLTPTFQLSKTQNLSLIFYLKFKEVWLFYNITLKLYRNKNILAGLAIEESDLDLPPTDNSVDVTSRRIVSTSLLRHEHLPEIKIRRVSYVHFEIFFLKTDKLKSAFKLRLASPGRKLLPILVYCIFKSNKLL